MCIYDFILDITRQFTNFHSSKQQEMSRSWEDRLWAAARAWLEVAVDVRLRQHAESSSSDRRGCLDHEAELIGGLGNDDSSLCQGLEGLDHAVLPSAAWPPPG